MNVQVAIGIQVFHMAHAIFVQMKELSRKNVIVITLNVHGGGGIGGGDQDTVDIGIIIIHIQLQGYLNLNAVYAQLDVLDAIMIVIRNIQCVIGADLVNTIL